MRFPRSWLLCLALLLGGAHAAGLEEVRRLHATGQTVPAIDLARRHIEAQPKDAAMRFQLGVMLAESGHTVEARELFERLVQDYPELPEPYNNLAALKAAAGDYDGAKALLDQALRANPALATAHENLGDVQLMLALRAYARARELDPASTAAQAKLALVRQLLQTVPGARP
ncbi:MAG: tetratricopeptide repeat protein [Piscinibacter sp.]|uniref:tetratricopeptide repeat protein n=1 Tax=Piscinibacter sp. TaxID=1903157 RepID=UPI003D14ACB0